MVNELLIEPRLSGREYEGDDENGVERAFGFGGIERESGEGFIL